jgi:pimeloyl-ACP methyl ester carboxylesterase
MTAVALVPGFFGFDHRESQTYFADRFIAGVRAGLEARGVHDVPVIAVSTLGIASLWRRQAELLGELRALEVKLGGPQRWHLVGHSTGGLDAALLLHERPLRDGGRSSVAAEHGWKDAEDLVGRVDSVITVSAPHHGTALAESALARWSSGHPSLGAVRDGASALVDLMRRGDLGARVGFFFSAMPSVSQTPLFLAQILIHDELARDLHPDIAAGLSATPYRHGAEERLSCIVTVAPRPSRDHTDKLFRDMWRWTHDGAKRLAHPPVDTSCLAVPTLRLPSQASIALPPIDGGDNDGVVSSVRQVSGTPLAVVIGDHVDVLGRYRRESLVDGKVVDPGLLTSGADFGDREFFGLIDRIADRLATSIRS